MKLPRLYEGKKVHALKCSPSYFRDLEIRNKLFELRLNDRDYAIGDILHLKEFLNSLQIYSGNEVFFEITYILTSSEFPKGLKPGYVILGLK